MSLWNQPPADLRDLIVGFQSLFSWMSLWNVCGKDVYERRRQVSILVFVDVALELQRPARRIRPPRMVSILVFVDVALEQD